MFSSVILSILRTVVCIQGKKWLKAEAQFDYLNSFDYSVRMTLSGFYLKNNFMKYNTSLEAEAGKAIFREVFVVATTGDFYH